MIFYIPKNENTMLALDVHLEGGGVVPPFRPDYLEGFIKRERAKVSDKQTSTCAKRFTRNGQNRTIAKYILLLINYLTFWWKKKLGDEVYDIFSTSENQTELETNIVAAYDKAKRNIERQTAKMGSHYSAHLIYLVVL